MSVSVRLADDIDISRGDMICRPQQPADGHPGRRRDGVLVQPTQPLRVGRHLRDQAHDAHDEGQGADAALPARREHAAPRRGRAARSRSTRSAASRCAPRCRCSSTSTAATASPAASSSIDEATNETVGAGMVLGHVGAPDRDDRAGDAARTSSGTRARCRATSAGAPPACAARRCGSPGCRARGSRPSRARSRPLLDRARRAQLHARRRQPAPRPERRPRLLRRRPRPRTSAGSREVARLFADAGVVTLVPVISPYRAGRDRARALHDAAGLRVRRGVRRHADRGVRAARPEGALRARPARASSPASPASTTRTSRRSRPSWCSPAARSALPRRSTRCSRRSRPAASTGRARRNDPHPPGARRHPALRPGQVGRVGGGRARAGRGREAGVERGAVRPVARRDRGRGRRAHHRQPLSRQRRGRAGRGAGGAQPRRARAGAGGQRVGAALPTPVPHDHRARRRGGVRVAVVRGLSDPGAAGRRRHGARAAARPHLRPAGDGRRASRIAPAWCSCARRTTRRAPWCRDRRSTTSSPPCPTTASSCSTRRTASSSPIPTRPTASTSSRHTRTCSCSARSRRRTASLRSESATRSRSPR